MDGGDLRPGGERMAMLDCADRDRSVPDEEPCFSIVSERDGTCFLRFCGRGGETVIVGLFANELVARAWAELLDLSTRIT
jgi:hypothetical protein